MSKVFSFERLKKALDIITTLETLGISRGLQPKISNPKSELKEQIIIEKTQGDLSSPNFIVTPNGTVIPIPNGATGPTYPLRGTGMVYQGGTGVKPMNKNTTGVRIMDANSNQGARVNYMNNATPTAQTVNPMTGKVISNKDPAGHIPIR